MLKPLALAPESPSKSLGSAGSKASLGPRRLSTDAAVHIQSPDVLLTTSGASGIVNMTCRGTHYINGFRGEAGDKQQCALKRR